MFNLQLYKEGLKRSAFIAVLFIVIMLVAAVVIPISDITSQMNMAGRGLQITRVMVEGLRVNPILIVSMIAFAPIVTLYTFSFINKRNSSDFYHSIPHKRETLFGSYTAAIFTWVLGGLWLCAGVTLLIYSLAPAYVILNTASILLVMLGISVGCVLVVGAMLIAIGLTGTTFSNLVTALLIIFLPRVILFAFTAIVMGLAPVVSIENFGIFGDSSHNIPFAFVLSMIEGGIMDKINQILMNTNGILYTGVLGLIYLLVATVLFKKRKSESAQSPALNRYVQAAVRSAIAFTVCIPAIVFITQGRMWHGGRINFTAVVVFYIIAIIAYFAYELITTKKLSSITKVLPGLLIVVALNVVFLVGVTVSQNVILNRRVEADEIASVRVLSFEALWGGHVMQGWSIPYERLRAIELEIQDEEINAFLAESLDLYIEQIKSSYNIWGGAPTTVIFETTSGRTFRRNIWLPRSGVSRFIRLLADNEEYSAILMTLPENPEELSIDQLSLGFGNLSEEALREIYAIFREEVRELDLATWTVIAGRGDDFGMLAPLEPRIGHYGEIEIRGFVGRYSYRSRYPLTNLTPRAVEAFIRHTNIQNFESVEQALVDVLIIGYTDENLQIIGHNVPYHGMFWGQDDIFWGQDESDLLITDSLIEILLDAVRTQGYTPVDFERAYFSVILQNWLGYHGVHSIFFFNTDNAELIDMLHVGTLW